jgi:hypothetical protein
MTLDFCADHVHYDVREVPSSERNGGAGAA